MMIAFFYHKDQAHLSETTTKKHQKNERTNERTNTTMTVDESTVRARYEAAKQDHVLKYLDKLPQPSKDDLLRQLNDICVEEISGLLEAALAGGSDGSDHGHQAAITPFSKSVGQYTDPNVESYYSLGVEAIGKGQVAALVLAGGQGTRLGFDGPKGMYNIGLPSGRTLFQLLCERLQRLETIAATTVATGDERGEKCTIPFYIMTSPINHQQTVEFFKNNSFFGLPESDVKFFQQGMLPCLTDDGKIIMEASSKVSMAPDG